MAPIAIAGPCLLASSEVSNWPHDNPEFEGRLAPCDLEVEPTGQEGKAEVRLIIIYWLKFRTAPRRAWVYFLIFGGAYSALCIFGVRTANDNFLSSWPANPFMIGMLVRFRFLAIPLGWVACLAGFAIAVPIMGCGLVTAAGLAGYNFGVLVIGCALLSRVDRVDQQLKRLISVFYLLFAVGAASVFAGVVGPFLLGPVFHDPAAVSSFRYWFSSSF